MPTPDFLRRQAENCLRIARSCFDLTSAERLRLMAAEFMAKADEMENGPSRRSHAYNAYSVSPGDHNRG
jgi:hypothetical protein